MPGQDAQTYHDISETARVVMINQRLESTDQPKLKTLIEGCWPDKVIPKVSQTGCAGLIGARSPQELRDRWPWKQA